MGRARQRMQPGSRAQLLRTLQSTLVFVQGTCSARYIPPKKVVSLAPKGFRVMR